MHQKHEQIDMRNLNEMNTALNNYYIEWHGLNDSSYSGYTQLSVVFQTRAIVKLKATVSYSSCSSVQ